MTLSASLQALDIDDSIQLGSVENYRELIKLAHN